MRIRPIHLSDLDRLVEMAQKTGAGFTSLPADAQLLEYKIKQAQMTFNSPKVLPDKNPLFLFVLEDERTGAVAGTTGIKPRVGDEEPFYSYRMSTIVHSARELDIYRSHQTLFLCHDYTGYSEIGSLFLLPEYRSLGVGKLLSKCRFMFMAQRPDLFSKTIFAEMRGVSDEQGVSPFWQAVGAHFFDMSFEQADYLSGLGDKTFIAELMPQYPLYVSLLPQSAQAVIGQVHQQTLPAVRLLEAEGFERSQYVDIFDAGLMLSCPLKSINTVNNTKSYTVVVRDSMSSDAPICLLARGTLNDFWCTQGAASIQDDRITLDASTAAVLQVGSGDVITAAPRTAAV